MKTADLLEFSACNSGPSDEDIWIYWYALVVKIHSFKDEFYNITLLWDNGTLTREYYHDLEFKVLSD